MFSQSYSIIGQAWFEVKSINKQTASYYELGYIPTLSKEYKLPNNQKIDFEWAYQLKTSYYKYSEVQNNKNNHRLWFRYYNQKIEARIGIQKIAFGTSQLLRSISWFDTINIKDPTNQTKGIEALRIQFFPSNSLTTWAWIVKNKLDSLTYGGRAKLSTRLGEFGLAIHKDFSKSAQQITQYSILTTGPHTRLGLDYRYDGIIGFWFEATKFDFKKINPRGYNNYALITLGTDFSLPIIDGMFIVSEIQKIQNWSNYENKNNQTISAIMVTFPLGILNKMMFITNWDWDYKQFYNFIQWSTIYDHFSINIIATINPENTTNSLNFTLIYNH